MRPLLLVLVILLAGCAASPSPMASNGSAGAPIGQTTTHRTTRDLGWLNQTTTLTVASAQIGFDVVVPTGGATDVHWKLSTANTPEGGYVDGPSCPYAGSGNVGLVISVGGTSNTGGSCGDLAAGHYTFHVNILGPTGGYKASVDGLILAP